MLSLTKSKNEEIFNREHINTILRINNCDNNQIANYSTFLYTFLINGAKLISRR